MTATYNGSSITTDTLYEDGTIIVKKGFNTDIDSIIPTLNVTTITASSTKNKIDTFTNEIELSKPVVNLSAITSTKQKEKIKIFEDLDIERNSLELTTIISSKQKTVIIIP